MARGFRLKGDQLRLSENDIERAALDLLRYRGHFPIRLNSGKFKTPDDRWITIGVPGLPDYCIPKYFLEVKSPEGQLSQVQRAKIEELRRFWNLETAVVANVDELIEWLARNPR